MKTSKSYLLMLTIALSIIQQKIPLYGANLNGSTALVYQNTLNTFANGERALGFVRINAGFAITAGATASLDVVVSCSGSIQLNDTGTLLLRKDLELDKGVTLLSGGFIRGRGNTIILNDTLAIPASKTLNIKGNTIIDGRGNTLLLNEHSQIFIENNSTLTLRNIVIKNTRNSLAGTWLAVSQTKGKLVLENAKLEMANDFLFSQGELYIHGDVAFTGTSSFIFTSISPLFVTPGSTLKFDINTTFSFAPASTINTNFVLQDRTSTLYLNACTLQTTSTGMRMTKGKLLLENKVNLKSNPGGVIEVSSFQPVTSIAYGTQVHFARWDPTGRYFAVGGSGPTVAGELKIYSFNGSTLTVAATVSTTMNINGLSWHPSGKFIGIAGQPTSGTIDYRIYSFNGTSLTEIATLGTAATEGYTIDFHPGGNLVALGGFGDTVQVYPFTGTGLGPLLTSATYGGRIYVLKWNRAGTVLAVGGRDPSGSNQELSIYNFNGSTLSFVTAADWGATPNHVHSISWTPDDQYLSVGGDVSGTNPDVFIYSFNGSTLTQITSTTFGVDVESIAWHPSGRLVVLAGELAASGGGFANTHDIRLYSFNGSTLTPITSRDYGTNLYGADWHPTGDFLGVGGQGAINNAGSTGFANTHEVRIYSLAYSKVANAKQAITKSILFGNSAQGSSSDLNVEVLGGAWVNIDGIVMDDSA